MRRQVVGGQWAAGGRRALRDPPAERAVIERLGATPGDLLERHREIRLHEALARQERRMIDAPERGAQLGRRRDAEEIVGVGRLAALAARGRKAVASVGDRVLQERVPRDG